MRRFLWIIILLVPALGLFAQADPKELWSTWRDEGQPDTVRLDALQTLTTEHYLDQRPDSALILAEMQFAFAERAGLTGYMAGALRHEGLALSRKGAYRAAFDRHRKSIEINERSGAMKRVAQGYLELGNLQQDLVQYDSSIHYYNKAQLILVDLKDHSGIAEVLLRRCYTAKNVADYVKAMEYAFEALRHFELVKDEAGMAKTYIDLADLRYYQEDYAGAIEYGRHALQIMQTLGDRAGAAEALREIGESHLILGAYDSALVNIDEALRIKTALGSAPLELASILNSRGNVYKYLKDHDRAQKDYERALAITEKIGFELGIMTTTASIGHILMLKGEFAQALPHTLKAIAMMEASGNKMNIVENYWHASTEYEGIGDHEKALAYYRQYAASKDSIFSVEKDHSLSELRTQYETEKKEERISALEIEARLQAITKSRNKQIRILLIVLAVMLVVLAVGLWHRLAFTRRAKALIQKERDRSEELLHNILPEEVAAELKEKGTADAVLIDHVTVLFTDFKGFTAISEQLGPKELVADIHECFSAFDRIIERHGIEKIKTIGDAYMAAGGLPTPNTTHAMDVILAALEIRDFITSGMAKKLAKSAPFFEIRIGIHTGPVVAGIVGVKKFQYDIWGDTVNIASRMESSGEAGVVNISEATYALVKGEPGLTFTPRGKVKAKGKGEMEMYFVELSS